MEIATVRLAGQNRNIVFRDNTFSDNCRRAAVDCRSDGSAPDEGCEGVDFYDNRIDNYNEGACSVVLNLESTQRARIYNKVFISEPSSSSSVPPTTGALVMVDGEMPAADGWFFNNTVVCTGDCVTPLTFDGTGHRVFNNVFYYPAGAGGASLFSGGDAACDQLGTSGEHFEHNFLYSPDASPTLPACGSGNSMTFDVLPGFNSLQSSDFSIRTASAVAGFGTDDGAPELDIAGRVRPSPPSAGAYDVP
jgi:hypothetical protein